MSSSDHRSSSEKRRIAELEANVEHEMNERQEQKRGRGRPRKNKSPNKNKSPQGAKRRGRPPKNKNQNQNQVVNAADNNDGHVIIEDDSSFSLSAEPKKKEKKKAGGVAAFNYSRHPLADRIIKQRGLNNVAQRAKDYEKYKQKLAEYGNAKDKKRCRVCKKEHVVGGDKLKNKFKHCACKQFFGASANLRRHWKTSLEHFMKLIYEFSDLNLDNIEDDDYKQEIKDIKDITDFINNDKCLKRALCYFKEKSNRWVKIGNISGFLYAAIMRGEIGVARINHPTKKDKFLYVPAMDEAKKNFFLNKKKR